MPYKSIAQERYFNANRKKLESQGVNVKEWNDASKGAKLPERKKQHSAQEIAASRKKQQPKRKVGIGGL